MALPAVSSTTPGASAHAAAAHANHPAQQPGVNNQAGGYPPPSPNGLANLPPRAGKRSIFGRAAGAIAKGVKGVFETKDAVPVQKKQAVYPDDPVKLRKILHKKYLALRDAQAEHVGAAGLGRMRDPASKKFKWGGKDYWEHEIAVARKFLEAEVRTENAKLFGETPEVIHLRKKYDKVVAAHNEYLEVLEKIKEHDPDFYHNISMSKNAFICGVQLIDMERSENPLEAGAADPLVSSMAAKMGAEVARIVAHRKNAGKFCNPEAVMHGERWHGHAMFAGMFMALPEMKKSLSSDRSLQTIAYLEAKMKEWHAVRTKNEDDPAKKSAAYEKVRAELVQMSNAAVAHAAQVARQQSGEEEVEEGPPQAQQPQQPQQPQKSQPAA